MTTNYRKLIIVAVIIAAITACTASAIIAADSTYGSVVFHAPQDTNKEDHCVYVAPYDNALPFDVSMTADLETMTSAAISAGYTPVPFTGATGESVRWPLEYGKYTAVLRDSDNGRMSIKNFEITDGGITVIVIG